MSDKVILVNEQDVEIGTMPKLEAHQKGALHRAFSIFIFNSKGEMLLQQRAFEKYHSGGLWSNACCSHPAPGETAIAAGHRRLMEEMGIQAALKHVYDFVYKVKLENDLTEHEFDHVFWGICDEEPKIDKNEISNWKYVPIAELRIDVKENPDVYTEWFKLCLDKVLDEVPFTEIW